MKLINDEVKKRFSEVGSQENTSDPIVVAKFFNPAGAQTWFATEYDEKQNICYGYVTGMHQDEWGYFSITEMEQVKLPFGLSIERDTSSSEKTISQWVPNLK